MVSVLATTILSCSDVSKILQNLNRVVGLTSYQKIEIIQVIKEYVPTCPVKIISNERPKLTN